MTKCGDESCSYCGSICAGCGRPHGEGVWISVQDHLPPAGKTVLLYFGNAPWGEDMKIVTGKRGPHAEYSSGSGDYPLSYATHWMPAPEPPK